MCALVWSKRNDRPDGVVSDLLSNARRPPCPIGETGHSLSDTVGTLLANSVLKIGKRNIKEDLADVVDDERRNMEVPGGGVEVGSRRVEIGLRPSVEVF